MPRLSRLPLAFLAVSLTAGSATFGVNSTIDAVDAAPGNGICATDSGSCSLRAAVMEANALPGSHTINVPAGLYVLAIPGVGEAGGAQGDLDLTGDVTIAGAGSAVTVIDGGGLDRVFEVVGTARISGMTIRNGAAVSPGAPTFGANFVGGLVENLGILTLTDCVLSGGRANAGGAIWSGGAGSLTMDRSTVTGGEAVALGITNAEGGGLQIQSPATITNSTISGNWSAGSGGGINVQGATVTLVNVTLSGNLAGNGGGISSTNGNLTLQHVTITNNEAGGLVHFSFDGSRKPSIVNSVFAGNTFSNCSAAGPGTSFVSQGGNVDSETTCSFALASDRSNASPKLGPLADNGGPVATHALLPQSAALDAGTGAGCAPTDARGTARPKGAACDSGAFESDPAATFTATRTIPIVLDVVGGTGAHFTSELTLANRGTTTATVALGYTAASALGASGSGTAGETLPPGRQLVFADALAYLRGKGVAIPAAGNQGGTLRAVFTGLSSADAAFAGARTTSASGAGRAGLAYPGPRAEEAGRGRVFVFGLRETAEDRTNLALVNAGTSGSVSVGITLTSGDPTDPRSISALGATLLPGQWLQANAPDLLRAVGMKNAWATIEPEIGTAPILAYAVFNDNRTDDGSYVPAVRKPVAPTQILPVLVESDAFQSELVVANPTNHPMDVSLRLALSLGTFLPGANPTLTLTLAPHEQRIIPSALQAFRAMGLGIEPAGPGKTIVGTLAATFTPSGGEPAAGFVGARTASPAPSGGGYGLFYPGVPMADAAQEEAWVFGLEQDASSRSNLALLNAGPGLTEIALRVDVFDAATGALAGGTDVTLGGGRWTQLNGILATYGLSRGLVRVTRSSGTGRFITYGVVNDGATPGAGTSDGSYVEMSVVR